MLTARGIIALAIDAPERGERKRPGKDGPAMWNLPAVRRWFQQHCGDYSRALDYLATRPDVDARRLGYVGFSWGAITGITFTAHDPRVKAMTSVVGGGLIGLLGKQLDPVSNAPRIAPRPLLFINASKDQIVLRPFANALHKAAGPHAIVKWYDTDHTFSNFDRAKIMALLSDFMREKLVPENKE
jgi:dienelactone hydrolase